MAKTTYLVVVNNVSKGSETISGTEIVEYLFSRGIWVFPGYAPHLRKLQLGDRLIIYLAGRAARVFVGEAEIASSPSPMSKIVKDQIGRLGLGWFDWLTKITNAKYFQPPRPISKLIQRLSFITDKKNYGLSLRQGIRRLEDRDIKIILDR